MEEKENFVDSELTTRATASLNEEVKEELKIEDPSEEKAQAALKGCCCRKRNLRNETKNN